ncbi:hypothetical protein D9611_000002 [Ephemerocybe angulata]|uniref:Uncharacterized protein n=1 Tax=Ephemerocybe angulata TaxID=980116 RepID=A0A8H5BMX6_9AGAR|nr:hypothetical protein D9611_000002 [Tulosesus angulatus]
MILFTNVVNQVMAYENLASVIVQALRYVTNMGFDGLVLVILDTLSDDRKRRLKTYGVNIADWLQSLAGFTGMLFRRYNTDLKPVLKYVVHRLHADVTSDITTLKELIWKMAGIRKSSGAQKPGGTDGSRLLWHPLEELFDAARKIAPTNAIKVIGPAFYLTFWQLSNYDLAPPNAYEAESNLLRSLSLEEDQKFTMADRFSRQS